MTLTKVRDRGTTGISTDLQPIKSDISALALREATNESSASFNLPNQHIDTFATDTLGTKTNASIITGGAVATVYTAVQEFENDSNTVFLHHMNNSGTDSSSNTADITLYNGASYSTTEKKFGTHSLYLDGSNDYAITDDLNDVDASVTAPTTGVFTFELWYKYVDSSHNGSADRVFSLGTYGSNTPSGGNTPFLTAGFNANYWNSYGTFGGNYNWEKGNWSTSSHYDTNWHHLAYVRTGGRLTFFVDGYQKNGDNSWSGLNVQQHSNGTIGNVIYGGTPHSGTEYWKGYIDEVRYSNIARYTPANDNDQVFTPNLVSLTSATGTIIQNTNTVGSAKTEVGGTMLYKDNSGTGTLGTDLKVYFTCDGGSNWTEASSYNAITPVYSTGIKQVRLGKTTCTSGTDVRYKVEWANQVASSKETQLHGIGINY